MPKVTKKAFKKAFNQESDEVSDEIDKLEDMFLELQALGGNVERFDPILDKVFADWNQIMDDTAEDTKGGYKKALKNLKDVRGIVDKAVKGIKAQKSFEGEVIGGDDKLPPMKFYTGSIPGFDKLDKNKQDEIKQTIIAKIKEGKELCDKVNDPNFDPRRARRPTREDLANFMWYVKSLAENKQDEPSAKGAVTLPDPGNKIRKYLSRTKGMYYRVSSHIEEQAKQQTNNPDGTKSARGVDYYDGSVNDPENLLPYGMKTVLMQSVDGGNGKRLYLKMETESAMIGPSPIYGTDTTDSQRWKNPKDVGRSIKHLKNLVIPEKDKTGLSAFREQTPPEDMEAYDDLMNSMNYSMKLNAPGSMSAMLKLRRGYKPLPSSQKDPKDRAKTIGAEKKKGSNRMRVFQMLKNMDAVLKDPLIDDSVKDIVRTKYNDLARKYPDGLDRFGSETVLDDGDMGREVEDDDTDSTTSESSEAEDSTSDSSEWTTDNSESEDSTSDSSKVEIQLEQSRKRASTTLDDLLDMIIRENLNDSIRQDEESVSEILKEKEEVEKVGKEVLNGESDYLELLNGLEELSEPLQPNFKPKVQSSLSELDKLLEELAELVKSS
jgi:hypothetical protein